MNRRFLVSLLCIFLAACQSTPDSVADLEPDVVLERAAQAIQKLDSAQYIATADFSIDSGNVWKATGVLRIDGNMNDSGEKVRFLTDIKAGVDDVNQGKYSLSGSVELVVIDEDQVYLNVHSLTSQPNSTLFRPEIIGMIAGDWWLLPTDDRSPEVASVTPDPSLLKAQSQVVRVVRDNGPVDIEGTYAYHYDVELDQEKLIAYMQQLSVERGQKFAVQEFRKSLEGITATGELWIDSETFFVRKLVWNVGNLKYSTNGTLDTTLTVHFRNFNGAPAISPPTSAKPFSPAMFFSLPQDALFETEILDQLNEQGYDDNLDNESIEELLRTINGT